MGARKIGRPVGSKSGREPAGGYPAIDPERGGFLAGFIEGEGSFMIRKQARNTNHACNMGLSVRDDDAELIYDLVRCTRVGSVTRTAARRTSRPQITWTVTAKADCLRLVEMLERYPLRGRKSKDYAIWRAAVHWWIADDPTRTYQGRDWTPLIYLKERLQEVKRFSSDECERVIDDLQPGLWGDWPGYVAGFFTAEGCVGIYRNGNHLRPTAQIRVRRDDRPLLNEISTRLDVGRVYEQSRNPADGAPTASLMVVSRDDLVRLVAFFERHPPRGRKEREFDIWRTAVGEYANDPSRCRDARMSKLRTDLVALREYRRPDHA